MREFQLLRYLSRGKFIILIIALAGAVGVYFYAKSQQVYTATTVLRYSNDAISGGLTPNGSKLDVSEIYSSTVIKGAIEDLGLSSSVGSVRTKVKVTPIIPVEEEDRKEAAISKNDDYYYFPTDYIVTYEAASDKSTNYAGNMLDAILENYYIFYSEKYIDQGILPNNASNISSSDYDYIECAEILQESVKDIDDYLLTKRENYPDFRASATGYTFADLENIYRYINNNKIPELFAIILDNRYTKDNDLLLKKQQMKLDEIQIELDSDRDRAEKIEEIIENFSEKAANETEHVVEDNGEEGHVASANVYSGIDTNHQGLNVTTTYDDLIQTYVRIQQSIRNKEIDIENTSYIKSVFEKNDVPNRLSAQADTEIEELVKILNDEYAIVQATATELNEYLGAKYLNIINSVVTSEKVNIKLYSALAVVFFLIFGCAGAVVIGRLSDFIEYIVYTDKATNLPNRQMCDLKISTLSEKDLPEDFTVLNLRVDNLGQINQILGRTAGDKLLRDFGDILKSSARYYGFVGWNTGMFIGLFDACPVEKAEVFIDIFNKRVADYNEKTADIKVKYSIGYANSTKDETYDIRQLIRKSGENPQRI